MKDLTGEDIGPLITFQDIAGMIADNSKGLSPQDKVEDHVCDCFVFRRPNMEDAKKAILLAAEENKHDASARKAAARETKADKKKRVGEEHKKGIDKFLDDLKGLVGDEVPWKSRLNERTWVSQTHFPRRLNLSNYSNRYDFRDQILQAVLKPYQKALGKAEKRLHEIPEEIQNVFDKKALMDQYIQRMVDFSDHPEAGRVLSHYWQTDEFCYEFYKVHNIIGEPLKDPRALKEEDLTRLCIEVKKVVHRRAPCDTVLEKLAAKLDGVPFTEDIEQNSWDVYKWAYHFEKTHIHKILAGPLLSPNEITDEKLDDLAAEVKIILEQKQEAHRKVELLLQPARKYTTTGELDSWRWDSEHNCISFFYHTRPRLCTLLNEKFSNLDNLADAAIVNLSKKIARSYRE